MKKKLSFIVPVYNVEDYLGECIDSILTQMTDSCEVILVDDGSIDSSGKICDEYAASYGFISVLHKENGGPSSARNLGMDRANGEYLALVDSDDRIAPGSVFRILEWIENERADICFLDAIKFNSNGMMVDLGDKICRESIRGKSREQVLAYLASRPKFSGSACTKVFRTEFLRKNQIWFPKDDRRAEDLGFCRDCFLAAESFDALPGPYYEYRQDRATSFTNTVSLKGFWDLGTFIEESVKLLTKEKNPLDINARYAMSFVAYEYSVWLWQYSRLSKEEKKAAYIALKEYQWVITHAESKKGKILCMGVSVLGVRMISYILDQYMKYR